MLMNGKNTPMVSG